MIAGLVVAAAAALSVANPNHIPPTTEAEAWWVYSTEVGPNDGCWADFSSTFAGIVPDPDPDNSVSVDDDGWMTIDTLTHPGFAYTWRPYETGKGC
jgi:hypothetical protein